MTKPMFPSDASQISRAARGASMVEYALVLSLVLVASIGAIQYLSTAGEQVLDDVSDDISTPREYQNVVVETPVSPPPVWVTTTVPPTILTWVDRSVATIEGCLAVSGTSIAIAPCGTSAATSLNGLSEDGVTLTLSTVDGTSCLAADTTDPALPIVSMQPCGGGGQSWEELSNAGATVRYEHIASGLCLQTIVPAAPDALTVAPCDGSSGQTVEVQF